MASLLRSLLIIARYKWDCFTRRVDMTSAEKQFPRDCIVNDFRTRDAGVYVKLFAQATGDVQNVWIKDIILYKKNSGAEHEFFFIAVEYHGGTVAYGVTERSWHGETTASSQSSGYQSPTPHAAQGSSMLSDATTPSPSNTQEAVDSMYFRSTMTRAAIATVNSTSQCTFTPNSSCRPYSFIKFLIICDSFTTVSPNYALFTTNSYFYTAAILDLIQDIIGGQVVYKRNHTTGKNKQIETVDPNGDAVKQAVRDTKELYEKTWASFQTDRARLDGMKQKAEQWDNLQASPEVVVATARARREIAEEEAAREQAIEEAARARRAAAENEAAATKTTEDVAQSAIANTLGISLSQAKDVFENLKASQGQSDRQPTTEGGVGDA